MKAEVNFTKAAVKGYDPWEHSTPANTMPITPGKISLPESDGKLREGRTEELNSFPATSEALDFVTAAARHLRELANSS
jgi:hypothetical protein